MLQSGPASCWVPALFFLSSRPTRLSPQVIVHQHLDATLSISYGPHRLGHYSRQGQLIRPTMGTQAVEKTPFQG